MSNSTKTIVVLIALVIIVGIGFLRKPPSNEPGPGSVNVVKDAIGPQLELARTALAATENLNPTEADESWSTLFKQMPEDASIALNRALNRVLRVDSLTEAANNSLLSADERQTARNQLPSAIENARTAVTDFQSASDDSVISLWLQSRVDLREASLLPSTLAKSLRRELFDRLATAIQSEMGRQAGAIILGGALIEVIDTLEDPINGLPSDIQSRAAGALETLSTAHPENLFISLRTARLNIAAKKDSAIAAIEQTRNLAAAIEPSLRAQTQPIGMTPDELIDSIIKAIKDKSWPQAENQTLLWFNVLNGTELVKTDRRRASPHPLDRLSFEALRRMSAEVAIAKPASVGSDNLTFDSISIASESTVLTAIPIDFDLDLDNDIAAVSATGVVSLYRGENATTWKPAGTIELDLRVTGILAADLFMVDSSDTARLQVKASPSTGDGTTVPGARHTSLATLVVYGDDGVRLVVVDGRSSTNDDSRLQVVSNTTGLEDIKQVSCVIAGDLEGDGDLDMVIATRDRGLRMFVNRGNRTFFEAGGGDAGELSKQTNVSAMAILDLDRDLDLDIVTTDRVSGEIGLVENLLHLQFRYRGLADVPNIAGVDRVFIAEIDGNVSWDLIVGGSDRVIAVYSQTAAAGAWTVEKTHDLEIAEQPFVIADFNNDAWFELLAASDNNATILRLVGDPVGLPWTTEIRLSSTSIASDFNLDGKIDVLSVVDEKLQLLVNQTEPIGHHVDVRFKGIDDNNANSGRVNHYAIGSVVELWFGPHYRSHVITSPSTHFGIGEASGTGSMRVIFPNGLTQTIREPAIDTLVEEEQTLKGSCPYLYTWDGEKYVFVTDCLWAAPLGLQVAAGTVAKDRPWEYLKVDGDYLQARDNAYELRITEELWEVAYFDHVSLIAVDHPADVQVWTNEKVGPDAIARPTIYAFSESDRRPLTQATDTQGLDVTDKLLSADRDFAQGFDRRLRQGLCPPHWIDLRFSTIGADSRNSVYLVLTGWILPTDTSLNIQIDQNPELPAIEFPSVWVPDTKVDGGWRNAIPFMGFPGGKTKTIVVDVSDVIDRSDPRLRIRTSAQIYWDHASLAVQSSHAESIATPLRMLDASLGQHGFSHPIKYSSTVPESYDYNATTLTPKWPPLSGDFTSYGDAKRLLEAWDDSMVVMGAGDELRLRFQTPEQPVREGWKRDFVLHCVGWDKDADLNTLTGQSAEPLPFKAMSSYPPTMDQYELTEKNINLNRGLRTRQQSFREFWRR